MLNTNPDLRETSEKLLNDPYFSNESIDANSSIDNDPVNEEAGIEILKSMTKFVAGKNLKRSVYSLMSTKKMLGDDNNKELIRLFNEIDLNKDGSIDVEELYLRYGKYFPGSGEEQWERVKQFINNIDINKSGKIEFSEFITVSNLLNKELNDKMIQQVFNFFDHSGDGFIEVNDIKEIFEEANISNQEFLAMVDEIDKNGDRKISFDEFKTMMLNN